MFKSFVLPVVAAAWLAGPSHSATLTLMAETASSSATSIFPNFDITFQDDGDNVLQFGEITAFSGFTSSGVTYTDVLETAFVANTVEGTGAQLTSWLFATATGTTSRFGSTGWTYTLADTTSPIPLPAGLPLLLAGIGGLAYVKRRKS